MSSPVRTALLVGGVAGFVGVAAGAMGAHALSGRIDAQALGWWRTAADYAQLHAVVLVAIGLSRARARALRVAVPAFAAGIAIFSGTLMAMALGAPRWFGAITPLGGLCLMAGWLALAAAAVASREAAEVAPERGPDDARRGPS